MELDRRNRRSEHRSERPGEAIDLFLAAAARRSGHVALALADEDGLLIGGSERSAACDALAAVAPLATRTGILERVADLTAGTHRVDAWPVTVHGEPFYVASLGQRGLRPELGAHLERILNQPPVL